MLRHLVPGFGVLVLAGCLTPVGQPGSSDAGSAIADAGACDHVTCADGSVCVDGTCQCPKCGAACCTSEERCIAGSCVNCGCGTKQCGLDACGKSCGACIARQVCDSTTGMCQPPGCATGTTACGATCCATGQTCLAGQCHTPDSCNDQCSGTTPVCESGTCKCSTGPDSCGGSAQCIHGYCCFNPCNGVCCGSGQSCDECGSCTGECATVVCGGVCCQNGQVCQCPAGQKCQGCICVASCSGVQCEPNQVCLNGRCHTPDACGDACNGTTPVCDAATAICQCTATSCLAPQACGPNAQCAAPVDYEWARWRVPPESPTSYLDGGDGTVTDGVTGLIWQKTVPGQAYDWADAIAYCAGLGLGGKTGWRLPTAIELLSIVDPARYNPSIDSAVFPNTPAQYCWTSTPYVGASGSAWAVHFDEGYLHFSDTMLANSVRCVWTPQPAAQMSSPGAPPGQYAIATETVTDNETGLTWQRALAAQTYDLIDAQNYCSTLSLGGFSSGWRLPAMKELATLVDFRVPAPGPTIDATSFPNAPTNNPSWTSSPFPFTPGFAWSVWFYDGDAGPSATADLLPVRCLH